MEGVVLHDNEEKCWFLMHHCAFMHPGIPLFYDDTDTYTTRQKNDHHVYHNATTVAMPSWCSPSTALENAHLTMKGARRCANRLVGSYSHVWTVCTTVNTHPSNSFSMNT